MRQIPVFNAEIEAGIADKVRSQSSIAYLVVPELVTPTPEQLEKICANLKIAESSLGIKLSASISDKDLYLSKSILASTNWNKNDDIFDTAEVWQARHTPSHKPSNFEHDEKVIIGHMIDTWCMDAEGNTIAEDSTLDSLPDFFHILDGSVIYRAWSDSEIKKQVEELIENIQALKATVSMECLFSGFDYGVITPEGEKKVVARNKETAFLTKYLKSYGGTGTYDGCKVGRLMRRMTFSGKGYVKKPANPASSAFPWESSFDFSAASEINPFSKTNGVSIFCMNTNTQSSHANLNKTQEISDMSEGTTKVLEDQVAELKASLKAAIEENKTLAEKSTKASVDKLEASVTDLSKKVETITAENTTVKAELETVKAANVELTKKSEELTTAKAALDADLTKIKAESTKASRITTLVAGGISAEEAAATVDKFVALTDEQFAAIADLAIKAAKAAFPPADDKADKEKKAKEKKAKDKAAADALENVETEDEPDLSASAADGDEDSTTETRKALASFLATKIGKSRN